MNDYYIYEYIRTDTNEVFYVGKGRGKRANVLANRNKYFKRTIKKYPFKVIRVLENLTESDAFEAEMSFIKYRKSLGQATCNLTEGGEGRSGGEVLPETREKIKKYRTGKSISEETRKKMAEAKKGNTNSKGITASLETRKKQSIARKKYYESSESRAKTSQALMGNQNGKKKI